MKSTLASYWENDLELMSLSSSPTALTLQFGSAFPPHEQLKSYAARVRHLWSIGVCNDSGGSTSELEVANGGQLLFGPTFAIQWCQIAIDEIRDEVSTPSKDAYLPRSLPVSAQALPHRFNDFVVIVILPSMILFIVVVLLACFMFGNREGTKSRLLRATSLQLQQYSSIRQASATLRHMSAPVVPVNAAPAATTAFGGPALQAATDDEAETDDVFVPNSGRQFANPNYELLAEARPPSATSLSQRASIRSLRASTSSVAEPEGLDDDQDHPTESREPVRQVGFPFVETYSRRSLREDLANKRLGGSIRGRHVIGQDDGQMQ